MNKSEPIAVEINALSKIYYTDDNPPVKAIDKLNLRIPKGQAFGILGASGAGKTTLVKLLRGQVEPTDGGIRLNGHNLAPGYAVALRQVGVVLEGTRNISQRLSIWGNLMHFGQARDWPDEKLKHHAEHLLQELDLWKARNTPVTELSRGKQRQVAFLCALVTDPPIVVLDEPLSGLDTQATQNVKTWLNQLTRERGKTVVLTTRHPDVAQEMCDHVAIINKGRLETCFSGAEPDNSTDQKCYHIKIKSHLCNHRRDYFDDLEMTYTETGETILSGPIRDQAALYSLISKVSNLGLPLLSVNLVEPSLKELFAHVTSEAQVQ